jgi:hypothetical protein
MRLHRVLPTALLLGAPVACDSQPAPTAVDPEANLPGDIDLNTEDPGGKADGWDYANDPARLSQRLNYRLEELPKSGKLELPVWRDRYPKAVGKAPVAWADTYWPTAEGSSNNRWQGATVKSPLEKYDAAFNSAAGCETQPSALCGDTAKASWDEYFKCSGPAATWQIKSFQSIFEQIDGIDNDNDGQKDECDNGDDEGAQGWWGLCHAWTPAALLEPEPQKSVTYNGVTFEVGDLKALVQTVYDRNEAMMLGGRCNAKTFDPDNTTSANDKCFDSNPGSLHVVVTNFIGINDSALAMDKTANYQVWNQPILGYDVTQQEKVDATRANKCVGTEGDKWTHNPDASELYEVTMVVEYLVEGSASKTPLGVDDYRRNDSYHYILEVGATGKVIGGRYCTTSEDRHPDFLWAPIRVATSSYGRNPHVALDKVQMLLGLAFEEQAPVVTTEEKVYESTTEVIIPDADVKGGRVSLEVPDSFDFKTLVVTVEVEHTWVGDLKIDLVKGDLPLATLHNNEGGSQQNLVVTRTLSPTDLQTSASAGTWTLLVVDNAARDTGKIKRFKLTFGR